MKKRIVLALIALLSLLLCAGCTQHAQSFSELLKEINALEQYTVNGEISVSIKDSQLSANLAAEGLPADSLDNLAVKYKAAADTKALRGQVDLEITFDEEALPLSIFIDSSHIYVKTADCLKFIEKFGSAQVFAAYQSFFGDAEWVNLLSEEDLELFHEFLADSDRAIYQKEYDRFITAFAKAYSGFDTKAFYAVGGAYKLTLDNASLAGLINDFICYTFENIEQIAGAARDYVNGCGFLTDEEKQEFAGSMAELVEAAAEYDKADLAYITAYIEEGLTDDCPVDFTLSYQISQPRLRTYKEETRFGLTYEADDYGQSKISLQSQITTRGTNELELAEPQGQKADFSNLVDAAQKANYAPLSVNIRIYPDLERLWYSESYALGFLNTSGSLEVQCRTISDHTYLPLRQIAEVSGVEANWDSAKKQPCVVVNDEPVYLAAFADTANGVTYIKVRDFEKLGYLVDYDAEKNLITLQK